jgi:hypothetical protein
VFNISGPMISSQGEARRRTYTRHVGKSGDVWFVPTGEHAAHNVLCSNKDKRGMGGAVLELRLADGTTEAVKGPWVTTERLFEDTGVDVESTWLTAYVIATGYRPVEFAGLYGSKYLFTGVLEAELDGATGPFNLAESRAYWWANNINRRVEWARRTHGGGCRSWAYPDWSVELDGATIEISGRVGQAHLAAGYRGGIDLALGPRYRPDKRVSMTLDAAEVFVDAALAVDHRFAAEFAAALRPTRG